MLQGLGEPEGKGSIMDEKLGKYKIEETLGQGGMGVVYRAWDSDLNRSVALKTIQPQLVFAPDVKARLLREAQAAARLQHPNVVTVYEFGEHEGRLFIAMEYVKGKSLSQLRGTDLSLDRKLEIMLGVCRALHYAHQSDIVHRDVKPSNVLIRDEDDAVKLLDFGIARLSDSNLTHTGTAMGTPEYMSPEMVEGSAIDRRSDIFSAGVVLYELLTASKPFHHDRITTIMYNILHLDPPPVSRVLSPAPPGLEDLVSQMIAKKPEDRFQTMQPVVEELEHLLSESVLAKAAKARLLSDAFRQLEGRFQEAFADIGPQSPLHHALANDMQQAARRVRRLSRASDTSVSLAMIEQEIASLDDLKVRIDDLFAGETTQLIMPPPDLSAAIAEKGKPPQEPSAPETARGDSASKEQAVQDAAPQPAPPIAGAGGASATGDRSEGGQQPSGTASAPLQGSSDAQQQPPPPMADEAAPAPGTTAGRLSPKWIALAVALPMIAGLVLLLFWMASSGGDGQEGESSSPAPGSAANAADLELLIRQAIQNSSPDEVLELARQLEASVGGSFLVFYSRGWALVEKGHTGDAVEPLRRAVSSQPDHAESHFLLGQAHLLDGRRLQSKRPLLRALQLGSLQPHQSQQARSVLQPLNFRFPAHHVRKRRGLMSLRGRGRPCPGHLEMTPSLLRFQSEECQSRTLALSLLEGIEHQGASLIVRQKNGTEYAFELRGPGDAGLFGALMGEVRGFEATESGEGHFYQVDR